MERWAPIAGTLIIVAEDFFGGIEVGASGGRDGGNGTTGGAAGRDGDRARGSRPSRTPAPMEPD
jgi:hypothetical protein